MKITILGCGGSGGVPMVGGAQGEGIWGACDPSNPRNERTRSSIVIEAESGKRLLVDSGPDLRAQLLRQKIGVVHSVLYTHEHADHVAGLDELRAINRMLDAPLPLYATDTVMHELEARYSYAFRPWSGTGFFRPVPEPHLITPTDKLAICDLDLQLFEQRHYRIPTIGLRCGDFAYSTDVEYLSEESLEVLSGVKTWIVGCFQYEPHVAHAWVDLVIEWCARLKPERTILTHMGPALDYETLRQRLPDGIEPGYDGMVLTV
ncbi:MBL fold metallo-hydrolase [Asaia bogorensis]|uniref:Metal-dependent hydrolase n=1 Tax=Asaia bogorensis NBRC 16594 TaxID=1231624 RepID=A0AAN4R3T3_9PROT|nr:MBL fold metallo-hydrolase [Asaia bogorensis]BAT19600.1 metal dependent hydrolase PhnP [Asaia bogorensis NBRC 16594]GBQ78281.1 metal-dependent hydrolase PhnP [Asaia bogorensis NBRC 16594]GEL53902.1 metal-dependent hydrolase [Asaia bogorensis NBRC 16594]